MKESDKIWYSIIAITILTICFLASKEFPEEPKRDNGIAITEFKDQTY